MFFSKKEPDLNVVEKYDVAIVMKDWRNTRYFLLFTKQLKIEQKYS